MTGLIIAVVVLFLLVIGLGILVWACIDYTGQVTETINKQLVNHGESTQKLYDQQSDRLNDQRERINALESDFDQLKDRNNKLAIELVRLNNSYTVSKKYWDAMASSHSILISNGETDHESE